MKGLVGVDKHAVIVERGIHGATVVDGSPSVVATGARQGPDLQVVVGRGAAFCNVLWLVDTREGI